MFLRLGFLGVLVIALTGCDRPADTGSKPPESGIGSSSAAAGPQEFDPEDLRALQSTWWTWAASTPEQESNPLFDRTGAHCASNQPKHVWFVAGTFGGSVERTCQVPFGLPLAGPAVNLIGERADCEQFMREAVGEVTLDGSPVSLQRADPMEIIVNVKESNPVTGPEPGEIRAFGCGIWFSIRSLTPGEHLLVLSGTSGDFTVKATYRLTVTGAT